MKKSFIVITLLLLSNISFAQGEANNWYFGNEAGITFNSGSPIALTDGALSTVEGCSTISDASGNLLFYSDGITVWNRNHQIMPNGTGLLGNPSSTQSGIIVPHPGNTNLFYLFSLDAIGDINGLRYSLVDMSLNGGLGDVTNEKNVLLHTPSTEKITAITQANGSDIWVITHKADTNEFYSYLVTDLGLNTTPVVTAIGHIPQDLSGDIYDSIGYMKISLDGTKIAIVYSFSEILEIFEFDALLGLISNPIQINNFIPINAGSSIYGVEFSPNNEFLYVSSTLDGIYQFDITTHEQSAIETSKVLIDPDSPQVFPEAHSALQLGPDGKIYVAHFEYGYLGVINNPNLQGNACDYVFDGVFLDGKESYGGLPPFIQSYFQIGFNTENLCQGNTTQFTANSSQAYDSLVWDFGDTNTSNDENPTHTFASVGNYDVSLTVTVGTDSTTESKTITIYEQPVANPIPDQIACDDDLDGFVFYDLTQHASDILNGQDPSVFELTYYDGIANYNNGTPLANPTQFENLTLSSADPVVRISNINNSDCQAIVTIHIDFLEGANPSQNVPTITSCDDTSFGTDTDGIVVFDLTQNEIAILNGQSPTDFTVHYFTDAALTNPITNPSAYQNTNTTETIYVQVVNNSSSLCNNATSFGIEVLELPTVVPVVELHQCDDDLDGFSIFNLTEVNAELSVNHLNETITYYETQTDAENSASAITNVTAYTNQSVSTDTVWVRIENTNSCYKTAQVNLIISTTQIPNTFTRDFYQCDDGTNTTDGIATFDFSSVNTEIQNLFPAGQQLIIAYYRNEAEALSELNPITDISNYQNIGYPNTQNIYVRVDSAIDNDCLGFGHHITLHVETVPIANSVTVPEQCDNDGDGMHSFDTSNIENTLLNGQTNVSVSYTDETGNPLSPLPNPFVTATQTITATVTNASSQDPDGACFDTTPITFTVEAAAVAYPVNDFISCDDNADGQFAFDTSTIEATVLNGQTGMTVSYTDETGNPLPSPLPNPFLTATQTITVRVENPLSMACYDETTINFSVSVQPIAHPIADDFVCDDTSNDGEHTFTLSDYDTQILNGQSTTTFEVLYFDNTTDAQNNSNSVSNSYLVDSTTQPIFARIQNRSNTNCFAITTFQLGVYYLPLAHQPDNILTCDDDNDGIATFDLSSQNTTILFGQSATDNLISYHLSQTNADTNSNAQNITFENTVNPQTIYTRVENTNNPNCYATTAFQIEVKTQPVLLMQDNWPICEGNTVDLIADEGYDYYNWSSGQTTRIITVDTPGNYTVTASNVYGDLTCSADKTVSVVISNIATITAIETIDWTANDNVISVFVNGDGNYEYSIDGINYQDNSIFTNLIIDEYTIYVKDKNGCGIATENVYLLYYAKFFTPNGDTINDVWQIKNAAREPLNKLYIYDRYGKLLKQLNANDFGWDGTINGNKMPSSDYWFVLERQNGKTYTGHFTLKR